MVSAAFGVQPVKRTGGKQDRGGNAEGFLVGDQLIIGASAVVGVLMNVDDRFWSRFRRPEQSRWTQQRRGGSQELSAGKHGQFLGFSVGIPNLFLLVGKGPASIAINRQRYGHGMAR